MKSKDLLVRKDLELVYGVGYKTASKYFREMKEKYNSDNGKYISINYVVDHSGLTHEQIDACLDMRTSIKERNKIHKRINRRN